MKIQSKWIIINPDGQIIDHELHWPFTYLWSIAQGLEDPSSSHRDSEQVRLGALEKLSAIRCQLAPSGAREGVSALRSRLPPWAPIRVCYSNIVPPTLYGGAGRYASPQMKAARMARPEQLFT